MEPTEWLLLQFLQREENRGTLRKTLGAGTRTNNKLNPHMTPRPGIEPGPHWREASALTAAPSLFPRVDGKSAAFTLTSANGEPSQGFDTCIESSVE